MTNFAIFPRDTAGATTQYITSADSADEAFAEFSKIVGDDAAREDFAIVEMTADEAAQIEQWVEDGEPADTAPEWLDEAIRRA